MQNTPIFPREVTSDVPRMTLTGQEMLHVEQHKGLVGYQPEEILFRTSCGMLRVAGASLRFRSYTAGEAVIIGQIDSVGLVSGGGAR